MMRTIQLAVACVAVLVATAGQVQAGVITFSIEGDSNDWPWIGRTFEPGTITGILNGLVNDVNGQIPTSIEFTSDVSALGITNNVVIPNLNFTIGGIDIAGGEVLSTTSFAFNFLDPIIGGMQFRLNVENRNVLHWNLGSGPTVGMGNANGFGGVTYSSLLDAPAPIPEPSSLAIFGIGACVVGFGMTRRRRRELATMAAA